MAQPIISVFGSSAPLPDSEPYEEARQLGAMLAEAGFTVATGGYGGSMAGVSRRAAEAGGRVVGDTYGALEKRGRMRSSNSFLMRMRFSI